MNKGIALTRLMALTLMAVFGFVLAQDNAFKIGMVLALAGPLASTGGQLEAAVKSRIDAGGEELLQAMKGQSFDSPGGPMQIDPETQDAIQNVYIRKVAKINNPLWTTEFQTFTAMNNRAKTET